MFSHKNKKRCRSCSYSAACLVDGRLRTFAHVWKSQQEAMMATPLPCELDDFGKADEPFRNATQVVRGKLGLNAPQWNRRLTDEEVDLLGKKPQ